MLLYCCCRSGTFISCPYFGVTACKSEPFSLRAKQLTTFTNYGFRESALGSGFITSLAAEIAVDIIPDLLVRFQLHRSIYKSYHFLIQIK